jgi:pimeloyl-ACP methyl ester carboxylesterase
MAVPPYGPDCEPWSGTDAPHRGLGSYRERAWNAASLPAVAVDKPGARKHADQAARGCIRSRAGMTSAGQLDVTFIGTGPPVVLVHGSVLGRRTWLRQSELGEHWTLSLPNRPGFGSSPPLARGDFEAEAPLIAELLGAGAHLVGHSYGAVIALYAAALRPGAVRSLTVSEPGCFAVAAGDPRVAAQIAHGELLYERASTMAPLDFLRAFRGGVGSAHHTPEQLEGELLVGTRLLMRERPPWEADPPLDHLRTTAFPKLVLSGGHSPVFEAVCDTVADRLKARRMVIAGRGHTIPATGAAYNRCLDAFLGEAERQRAGRAPIRPIAGGASRVS